MLPHVLGQAYERIAREVLRRSDAAPFRLHRIGRWWDPAAEIDVVGLNEEANAILFTEVKWSVKPVGTDILRALRLKSAKTSRRPGRPHPTRAALARKGFTPDVRRLARDEGILLFEGDQRVQ